MLLREAAIFDIISVSVIRPLLKKPFDKIMTYVIEECSLLEVSVKKRFDCTYILDYILFLTFSYGNLSFNNAT